MKPKQGRLESHCHQWMTDGDRNRYYSLGYIVSANNNFLKSKILSPCKVYAKQKIKKQHSPLWPVLGDFSPFMHLLCPTLTQEKVLSLNIPWYFMFCWYQWKACTFLNINRGRMAEGREERLGEWEGGMCQSGSKINLINKNDVSNLQK